VIYAKEGDMSGTKGKSLYATYWSDKRYLRTLTCRKACDLSHAERLVLSYLVYKARDEKGVKTRHLVAALGLDRRTVRRAIKRLVSLGLAILLGNGHGATDPLSVRPEWFADPHEGEKWWERVRTYRYYPLRSAAKRSRGNPSGSLTEGDNAVLWALYSLGRGGKEIVGQRIKGLASLLGFSPHTIRAAIRRLSDAKLVMKRSDGFTLLEPSAAALDWWRDRPNKEKGTRERGEQEIQEPDATEGLDWLAPFVDARFPNDTDNERDLLVGIVEKRWSEMLRGKVKPKEFRKFAEEVLMSFTRADPAWDFCALVWPELWKDAYTTHVSNGKYSGSCIHLLTSNTKARLASRQIDLTRFF
jgi:DNA-binding MarR family transcriptional regulator